MARTPDELANAIQLLRQVERDGLVLVEGDKDDLALARFFLVPNNIKVAGNKEIACRTMEIVESRGIPGVVAIVDPDLDLLEARGTGSPNILTHDCHDLETALLRSSAFDRILREFGNPTTIDSFVRQTGMSVREVLLEAGKPIGYLRWLSFKRNWNLKFEGLTYSRFINRFTLSIDVGDLVDTVKNNSQRPDLDRDEVLEALSAELGGSHDPWHVCNGHDLVSILSVGFRKALASRSAATVSSEALQTALRLAYDASDFSSSALFAALEAWEISHHPFRILRD